MLDAIRSNSRQWRAALGRQVEKRLPALTRHRLPEALPIRLHSRRIYILPTRFGLVFALIILAMLMGALNFNNNPALLLSLWVASAAVLSFHLTVAQLRDITLTAIQAKPVHAGAPIVIEFLFQENGRSERPQLIVEHEHQQAPVKIKLGQTASVSLQFHTAKRGWFAPGRIRLWSEYPFGLVWAWSYLHPEQPVLVYASPEVNAPLLPEHPDNNTGKHFRTPGDDWHGLREHRLGDAPKRMAWRASARADRLLVKEFADSVTHAVLMDYAQLQELNAEQRISRLTRWVMQARDRNIRFELRLPGKNLGPGQGEEFAALCLRELALLP